MGFAETECLYDLGSLSIYFSKLHFLPKSFRAFLKAFKIAGKVKEGKEEISVSLFFKRFSFLLINHFSPLPPSLPPSLPLSV